MHLSLIFLEFLSEMDLEVLGLPSKISAERAVLRVLSEESSRECPMRIAFDPQRRFDCPPVLEVRLNTSCRDEIIPILKGLQHIYSQTELRDELLDAVAQDVNGTSSADLGRPGMTYWSILVLGAVRLGCNFDYDRLQNLAEEHRSLRQVMGIGGWCDDQTFDWRCLRDNICLLSPDTIERVNHLIVAEGHRLVPEAAETVRGDSFVPATNIHYPTDSSLIGDGLRTIVPLAVRLARLLGLGGWRQRKHLLRTVKKQLRAINKIAKGKGRDFPKRLQDGYRTLLDLADRILARALELLDPAVISIAPSAAASRINMLKEKLTDYLNMTIHVCDLARRRVLEGERIDNSEKLFSLFEPHTEFKFRRFQGGSRAARRVKFPPANRSWRGAGGRDLRPKCHLPCSAEKLGELGDPGFQARLFWKRLWHFFLVADPPQGRQHVGKRWLFLLPVPRSEGKT